MKSSTKLVRLAADYGKMTLAGILYAAAFCLFYQPNAISPGGFTGISQILNHFLPFLPIGVTTIALNLPLFIIGTRRQGLRLLVSSVYSMTLTSVLIDLFGALVPMRPMDDLLLAAGFGGLLTGCAVGLLMRVGATTGGTELFARLLKYRFPHIPVGKLCLAIDLIVIALYAVTFRQLTNALYGVVSMYIFSLAVDFVVYGGTHAKMAYIISEKGDDIRRTLLSLDLGVTLVKGEGGFDRRAREMLLCAFRPNRIAEVKSAVTEADPDAFLIVCDAHEIVGEGFGSYHPGDL